MLLMWLGGQLRCMNIFRADRFNRFLPFDLIVKSIRVIIISLVQDFFILMKRLFGGFIQIKTDFFSIFVCLGSDSPTDRLVFSLSGLELIIYIHHFNDNK